MSGESPRRAVIALGGNLGDRLETIRSAMRAIDDIEGVRVSAASSVYETPALTLDGIDDQAPRYLNAVVIATIECAPQSLLLELQRIEDSFGRQRLERWGSRTLDLDLIDVEGMETASETLELPHPRAWQRAFVLAPWHEIDPDAQLAGRGSVADLLSAAPDRVELFAEAGFAEAGPDDAGRFDTPQPSSDRGLPLIGPDSQAQAPRPIRGGDGETGFGSGMSGGGAT